MTIQAEEKLQALLSAGDRGNGTHAADGEQIKRQCLEGSFGLGGICAAAAWLAPRLSDKIGHWQGHGDDQQTENFQGGLPAKVLEECVRDQRHSGATQADSE